MKLGEEVWGRGVWAFFDDVVFVTDFFPSSSVFEMQKSTVFLGIISN